MRRVFFYSLCLLFITSLSVTAAMANNSAPANSEKTTAKQQPIPIDDVIVGYGFTWPWYPYLNEDQQSKADKMIKESSEKTKPLRERLLARSIELKTHAATTKPDASLMSRLSDEIAKIYGELKDEGRDLEERLHKSLGFKPAPPTRPDMDIAWVWSIVPYSPLDWNLTSPVPAKRVPDASVTHKPTPEKTEKAQ